MSDGEISALSTLPARSSRKSKSWTKSLKKATNSILYMAIPPTGADQLPMVVPHTPMSPDRLIPALHSSLLQSPPLPSFAASDISTAESSTVSVASSSSTASTSFSKPRSLAMDRPSSNSMVHANATRSEHRSSSSSASSSLSPTSARQSAKGKGRAEPLPLSVHHATRGTNERLTHESLEYQVIDRSMPPVSPPSSPSRQHDRRQHSGTTISTASLLTSSHIQPPEDGRRKSFPSPPPSPLNGANSAPVNTMLERARYAPTHVTPADRPAPETVTHIHAIRASEKRHDIVLEFTESNEEGTSGQTPGLLAQPEQNPALERLLQEHEDDGAPDVHQKESALIADSQDPSGRGQKTLSMVVDASGFPMIPSSSFPPSRRLSRRHPGAVPAKNAPWVWHQDGIRRQRLESHQILTKEQVFEQFHLDLEQEGPNGFFLFKLVKRFKRQDSSILGITSSLLDAEISASPMSASPPATSSPSILDSIDAVSVSQKLKRQLLLQKRKKQRKSSSSDSEEDENLEALLKMSTHNTSLQNLNLQEVIDAYDSLKDSRDWTTLMELSREPSLSSRSITKEKPQFSDSDGEYTSRDKHVIDTETLEKRRGVYATGRLDGMSIISKKRYKAMMRRSSMSATSSLRASAGSTLPPTPGSYSNDSSTGEKPLASGRRASEATADGSTSSQKFKKQAVAQLHIYSKNGLKFKFDVMEDNELHFVEASKKYTFMDPLAPQQQPDLVAIGGDAFAPLASPTVPLPPGSNNTRRISSGTIQSASEASRSSRSSKSRSVLSSSSGSLSGNRRVFVTRLGRHTVLTYAEYKVLTKSASSFTLGAKLLLQRSIAVATPSFYGSASSPSTASTNGSNGYTKDYDKSNGQDTFSAANPTSEAGSSNGEGSDYFSVKKKSRSIPGFASKAVAAIKSPSTPPTSSQAKSPRPIVTPYNPAEYKNKSLTVSTSPPAAVESSSSEEQPVATALFNSLADKSRQLRRRQSSETLSTPLSPSESSPASTSQSVTTPSSTHSTSSNPYNSLPIKRQGNQAGIKFQHLFVTIHQRLQKLELDSGGSFYRSALVQWTVIEDPAELRWWRDKIGIQMIGALTGDDEAAAAARSLDQTKTHAQIPQVPHYEQQHDNQQQGPLSTMNERSSFVSTQSYISDASSSSAQSATSGYRSRVSVERLGYRFLRISGHMGTLKVTVSEQVEARAVALAVRAEMLKQRKVAEHQNQYLQKDRGEAVYTGLMEEQPWIEMVEPFSDSDSDSDSDADADDAKTGDVRGDSDDEGDSDVEGRTEGRMRSTDKMTENEKKEDGFNFYDAYEYDEWMGRTRLKRPPSEDRFSRRERHDRRAIRNRRENVRAPLIERMTMIVGQARVFKGDWYMKNVYKFQ
ncbi:hypothetical protein BGX28_007661 [Mortierella sp. GBA30]|nr:hypothetical protein BGX28_007661 [Mortierella sp. GBA30]